MVELLVDIEINGEQVHVGTIRGTSMDDISFSYDERYIEETNAPISISMPVRKEAFGVETTRNFFEGLLPEGFTRRTIAKRMRVDNEDYVGLLSGLGQECLGAIRIYDHADEQAEDSYELLSKEQVCELAREGVVKSTEILAKTHLSLTGASGKVGLYYDGSHDNWYMPIGILPSTHIVKLSHVRLEGIVANEQLALMTARRLGIDVPQSFVVNVGQGEDSEVLFATERYDRKCGDDCHDFHGLKIPHRLHQEDFAQAMGVAARDKYEKDGEGYLRRIFDLVRRYSSNPIEDTIKLWDMLVYDYLIGNTDNHIKNCSMLYTENLKGMRLAPAYDILSTSIYDSSTRDMAMSIGGKFALDEIDRGSFEEAASEAGLGRKLAMERFDRLADAFESALKESAAELKEIGIVKAENIKNEILLTGGIARLG